MFILAAPSPPTTADALAAALAAPLVEMFSLPDNRRPVVIQAATYPAIQSLAIDLSGARVRLDKLADKPVR